MFTILIPVLKEGYLKSQLSWLQDQTYKNFSVIVLDSFYKSNKYFKWSSSNYDFNLNHLPLIHNIKQSKRYDFSIKNNLALLCTDNHFVMVSDTHYFSPEFCRVVADEIVKYGSDLTLFPANTLLYNSFKPNTSSVDLGGETNHISKPAILFDTKSFFYLFNGYDEVSTYCHGYENMHLRSGKYIEKNFNRIKNNLVYHILHTHSDDSNEFGFRHKEPCEICSELFSDWQFDRERQQGRFFVSDSENCQRFLGYDSNMGVEVFRCPNCGFCGTIESTKLDDMKIALGDLSAPEYGFDGDVGRGSLSDIYDKMNCVAGRDIRQRFSFLKRTYK